MTERQKKMGAEWAPIKTDDNGTSGRLNSHVCLHYSTGPRRAQIEAVNDLIDQALRLETRAFARADVCDALGHHDRAAHWDRQAEKHGAIRRELESLAWEVACHG